MLASIAMISVAAGLATTMRAQLRPIRRYGGLLDRLAIVPEWKFYAQTSLAGAINFAQDIHLVVRDRDRAGGIGSWRPVRWHDKRRTLHMVWNPRKRHDDLILSIAEDLVAVTARDAGAVTQYSHRYLVLLRECLNAPAEGAEMDARQFAVVRTVGRGDRELSLDFLSAWHRP